MRVYTRLRREEKLVKEANVYEKANETYIYNFMGCAAIASKTKSF